MKLVSCNRIKLLIALNLSFLLYVAVQSQEQLHDYQITTSQAITLASPTWQQDSLGKLGLRLKAFHSIRYSKIDTVTKTQVLNLLGMPNQTSRFYSGITKTNYSGLIYYTICMNDYPKDRFYWGGYIEFIFDEYGKLLLDIRDGDFCG